MYLNKQYIFIILINAEKGKIILKKYKNPKRTYKEAFPDSKLEKKSKTRPIDINEKTIKLEKLKK